MHVAVPSVCVIITKVCWFKCLQIVESVGAAAVRCYGECQSLIEVCAVKLWCCRSWCGVFQQSASPRFQSLIDVGALITGMTNRQVAEALLLLGLKVGKT